MTTPSEFAAGVELAVTVAEVAEELGVDVDQAEEQVRRWAVDGGLALFEVGTHVVAIGVPVKP